MSQDALAPPQISWKSSIRDQSLVGLARASLPRIIENALELSFIRQIRCVEHRYSCLVNTFWSDGLEGR